MKKQLSIAAGILAMGLVSSQAMASDLQSERWPRWYVGLSGGVQFLQDSDFSGAATGKAKFNTGEIFTASLGYMPNFSGTFFNGLRFELEGGYHNAGLNNGSLNGVPRGFNGRTEAWTYMGNLYYDFRNASRWTPYVGAGLGGADVRLSSNSGLGNSGDSNSTWGYQFMAGISYAPENIPMTEWSLGYRYLVLNDPEFTTASAGKLRLGNLDSSNVELGAKFRF